MNEFHVRQIDLRKPTIANIASACGKKERQKKREVSEHDFFTTPATNVCLMFTNVALKTLRRLLGASDSFPCALQSAVNHRRCGRRPPLRVPQITPGPLV